MSETAQETLPSVLTDAVPQGKELNAEAVTTMSAAFLKRIGHKGSLKPKRVSLEGDLYTVEVEMKRFTATVKVDVKTHEIKEYDVQPRSEESSFGSFSPKFLLTVMAVSGAVYVGFYFGFKMLGF